MFSIRRILLSKAAYIEPLYNHHLDRTVNKTISVAKACSKMDHKKALSFEEFKAEKIPSFDEVSKEIIAINKAMSIEVQHKIYEGMCQSQYRRYVQILTNDNDPGKLL